MHLMLLNENLKGRFNKGVKAHLEDKRTRRANACMLGHTPCQYVVYSTKQRTYHQKILLLNLPGLVTLTHQPRVTAAQEHGALLCLR